MKLPWYFSIDKSKGEKGLTYGKGHIFIHYKVNRFWFCYQKCKLIIKRLWQHV